MAAVLPVLHLNGFYKIANPTLLARIPRQELTSLLRGYGWEPIFVEGHEPMAMHRAMAAAMDQAVDAIQRVQASCRASGEAVRPAWPMIVLRSPKGWTGPAALGDKKLEDFWRSHQVPLAAPKTDPQQLAMLEGWMRSYRPEELFDRQGTLLPDLQALSPQGPRRMGSSPHANGGQLRRSLRLPPIETYAVEVDQPGHGEHENTAPLGALLRDTIARNPDSLRVFGPDETASNRLQAIYEVSKKVWMEDFLPEDMNGSELAREGRVVEMLSEHPGGKVDGGLPAHRPPRLLPHLRGLRPRDRLDVQPARQVAGELHPPRALAGAGGLLELPDLLHGVAAGPQRLHPPGSRLHRSGRQQERRGGAGVSALRPDANTLLAVAEEALVETNVCNIIVSDKQKHLQYLSLEEARRHVAKGISLVSWACNDDQGTEPDNPDVVMACAGDIPTKETLAAVQILRRECPQLKIRVVNVVKLFALTEPSEHPHGLSDRDFDSLFTTDRPVMFNFHGYPWLIHRLTYRRTNHANFHVRGYKEKGNINTPLELAMNNQIDRFNLVMDVIDRVPALGSRAAHVKERMKNAILANRAHAHEHGMDAPEITNWRWSTPEA